ncbi:DUF3616 domain-containing protein [Methylobacterium iners]|uniref:DUF3616 domain-containing protein n=1 Tax=Methylobacterium iners TaxID=418707 RepID=UPI001EE36C59|nr:DUF3616 domain-containing protein [Methylobacterium iners]
MSLAVLAIGAGSAAAREDALAQVGPGYILSKDLAGGGSEPANDISGIACLPAASGPRHCLLVNDENAGAQFVTIEGTTIRPGPEIRLVGAEPSAATLGTAPTEHRCSEGKGRFSELDGEGIAYAAPYFYVIGSHGCSRRGNTFKLSAFVLARIRFDGSSPPTGREPVETTYRFSDALRAPAPLREFFAVDLQSRSKGAHSRGLNVEGLAVVAGTLHAGLRAPTLDGEAFLVTVPVEALFAPGHAALQAEPRLIPIATGKRTGIRDLTPLPDGRLLVLTGPAQEQEVGYGLIGLDPLTGATTRLGRLPELREAEDEGKPEAIALVEPGRLLVFFDSLPNGAPRAYALP